MDMIADLEVESNEEEENRKESREVAQKKDS